MNNREYYEKKQREEFPEEHPDTKPTEATLYAIIGILKDRLGLADKPVRLTARLLREWRLRGVKITAQKNGSAILSMDPTICLEYPVAPPTTPLTKR